MNKVVSRAVGYAVIVFPVAYAWHLVVFEELYRRLGYFDREPPIVALGFLAIVTQGSLLSVAFRVFDRGGPALREGLRFGLLAGAFLWTSQVLAAAAKHEIDPISTFLAVETGYFALQFTLVGVVFGLLRDDSPGSAAGRPGGPA